MQIDDRAYENWDMQGEGLSHADLHRIVRLLDKREVLRLFGGTKPINTATLYRGIRQGRFPKPMKVGGSSRWLRTECEAVLQAMVEGRQS
jgi:predicted DNA-binding transcriptional regulator AlpA